MSNVVSIPVEKREQLGSSNSRRLRRTGNIPAILYGRGAESIALCISANNAGKLLGHTGIVELTSEFLGKRIAILKEIKHNSLNGKIIHLDLQVVKEDEVIIVPVPVVSYGEPVGLKQGGQLEQVLRELELECLPSDVPEMIKVDVSGLEMDHAFHIGDLQLAPGLKVIGEKELTIFHVRAPRTSEEAESVEDSEADADAPEAVAAPEATAKKKA
ncbi:MAG: 50S ribosomal protein L25 [Lentisphaeria bacterium]